MNDSELRRRHATQVIERIIALLDETHLAQAIDESIDAATEAYCHRVKTPDSYMQFNDIISEYVFHVYKHAQACPHKLNRSQARDEAVALLEQAYEGTHANGYPAALLDATDASQDGMDVVLCRITDIIKSHLRQNYRRWIFAHCIDPSDWRAKCDIAAILLNRCSLLPPGKKKPYDAEQFVDHIPELLEAVLSTEQLEQQASSASFSPGN